LDIEEALGTNWLNKLGIAILVLGVAFFLAYQLKNLGPAGKVLVGAIISAAMLGTGLWFERSDRYRILARAAIGGGWALAAAMDFVVAAETAEFWLPEVELGAPFSGVPGEIIARRVGPWRAKEIMILCRHYMARDLLAMGMVNQVVKPAELMPTAHELARNLLKMPRGAATATKHAIDNVAIGPRLY